MAPPTIHVPVLPAEVLHWLDPQPGKLLVDGTLGGGGHTRMMAERVGEEGCVISVDRDVIALERAEQTLAGLPVKIAHANFVEIPKILDSLGIDKVDGILLDLGLSSDQLADDERGFSFDSEGPLDLRFDARDKKTAADLVNHLQEKDLADLIYQNGEERLSRRIARKICLVRKETPFLTAKQLADVICSCYPHSAGSGRGRIHPATRTFQALRIAVNRELSSLETALDNLPDRLKPGGRLAIISFHSLEDRPVKQAFLDDPRLNRLTKKPVIAGDEEIAINPRSRTAKLRVAERVA
ncbi:16S rRNA (cytosine(1402)-N(4))-methyltransferase RsmH [Bremerella cremea]|uniref:Ribosomal RNA small subunit methyltransferase H n=1 Tax=Bremerella cremea TaxID=1031537 RepID=A0A368KVE9_9BACT|nr:16S rRNA (cytosine(1402)-N(4))-methyltransferase RsmH [Bremerella cremea]RCS54410.1 16S rRNA (cytosine(1402)-N(4))-methyltransferase RsmH [Bremerella cremea]